MHKPLTHFSLFREATRAWVAQRMNSSSENQRGHWSGYLMAVAASTLVSALHPSSAMAESPDTAPAQLKNVLSQIDAAANSRNVQSVLQFYSPNFTHSDGLTRQSLGDALTQLWKRYPNLSYRTELKSWKPEGSGFIAETTTRITGTQKLGDRELKLDSSLKSQQRFENQKIVNQEVLAERSQITSGTKPPNVALNLPEKVTVGQEFTFDAVVQEPLGNDLLLGAALEEPVKVEGFANPTTADLELLSAGGIFKVGRAPDKANSRWISAILVRQDGMTIVTQRLQVVERGKSSGQK